MASSPGLTSRAFFCPLSEGRRCAPLLCGVAYRLTPLSAPPLTFLLVSPVTCGHAVTSRYPISCISAFPLSLTALTGGKGICADRKMAGAGTLPRRHFPPENRKSGHNRCHFFFSSQLPAISIRLLPANTVSTTCKIFLTFVRRDLHKDK
jgi:hypothetical protein